MRLPLAALAAVLAFCVLAAGPAPARAAGEVLLGMNYPLTGPYSVEGLDQIRAARLAVDQINAAGGILGRRAVLVPPGFGLGRAPDPAQRARAPGHGLPHDLRRGLQ